VQMVSWTAYVSTDGTASIDAGARVIDSATTPALGPSPASTVITFSGSWPSVPGGPYFLKVKADSPEDIDTANNISVSGGCTTTFVDYTASGVTSTGGTVAGTALGGQFTLQNLGSGAGSQPVTWKLYVSSNATLDAGDALVASGTNAALASGGSTVIGFVGAWPSTPGAYYLIVSLSAADDTVPANDTIGSAGTYTTTFVDYTAAGVASTGLSVAGQASAGQFTLKNIGSAAGGQPVSWKVFVSANTILDAGDSLVASGSNPALGSGGSTPVVFAGSWPSAPGTYYLIVSVSAADDSVSGNNTVVSALTVTTTAPLVDNTVVVVSNTGGSMLPAGTVNGSFQFRNIGPDNGTQPVAWTAYASASNVLDSSAVQIASGFQGPLAGGATSAVIPFSGVWPLHYGSYYLLVSVSAPEDSNITDNTAATAATTTIGVFNEIPTEPNGDYVGLSNYFNLGVTLKPGMTLLLTGSMNNADLDDVLAFNTGTAGSVSFYMSWTGNHIAALLVMNGPNSYLAGVQSPNTNTISFGWIVDMPGTMRWMDVTNVTPSNIGTYQLVITGN
jgi:hypothetical protein